MDHCVVGVQILHQLVVEMNQVESMRSLTNHRKVASSFKDESLYDIFTLSCTLLRQINVHDKTQVTCVFVHMTVSCISPPPLQTMFYPEEDRHGSKVLIKVLHWRTESSTFFLVPRINIGVVLQI